MKRLWRIFPFALFLLLSLFLWRGLHLDPKHLPSAKLGQSLPDLSLSRLEKPDEHYSLSNIKGEVALLNVWASWCAACTEEQVMLLELARHQLPLYGLNYKDKPSDAQRWLKTWGNPYRLILSDIKGQAAMDLGVYGAPETFVIDKQGRIRYRHVGILDQNAWHDVIQPLMEKLRRES